jgi:NADPH-dependent ferric siderophore reductase
MAAGYRIFNVVLTRRIQVSPSLLRCVFTGPDVAQMKHESPDQRIKLLFTTEGEETATMSVSDSWYQDYLALPKAKRPVMRTYTLRELRVDAQEVDVEFVLHGDGGPASRWATHATPGDALQMVAPNGASDEDSGGYEWLDNDSVRQALLIADETALPAAMGILEELAKKPNPPHVQAFFTVPHEADFQPQAFPFADVRWLARDRNDDLLSTVEREVTLPAYALAGEQSTEEHSLDGSLLWERASEAAGFQAWVAAESTLVKNLRRSLIEKQQLNRECASFMAYWAQGRA